MSLASPGCADPDGDLPRPYSRIEVPTALLASADAKRRGQEVFQRSCALCHGVRGDGQGDRREGLARPPRNFTDPGWRRSTTPRRVFYAIREGITGTPMPAAPSLSDQQTWDVTAFVLSLGETR
jgi:mono/diheme cytochrome c family protein